MLTEAYIFVTYTTSKLYCEYANNEEYTGWLTSLNKKALLMHCIGFWGPIAWLCVVKPIVGYSLGYTTVVRDVNVIAETER